MWRRGEAVGGGTANGDTESTWSHPLFEALAQSKWRQRSCRLVKEVVSLTESQQSRGEPFFRGEGRRWHRGFSSGNG